MHKEKMETKNNIEEFGRCGDIFVVIQSQTFSLCDRDNGIGSVILNYL